MPLVQTTEPTLARDTESRALVVTDAADLHRSRASRASSRRLIQQHADIDSRFDAINQRLDKYDETLLSLVMYVKRLVDQNAPSSDLP